MLSVAMLPWWSARAAADEFQAGLDRGSLAGQLSSHAVRYHGAGLNGSCAA